MPTIKKEVTKKTAIPKTAVKKATAKKVTAKKTSAKKTDPPKTAPKAESLAWSIMHIFGYGETQIIGKDINGKVPNSQLKSLQPFFLSLLKKQQKGTKISLENTHFLNIFNGSAVDFRPKGGKNKSQSFKWQELDKKQINKLAEEIIKAIPNKHY